MGLIFVNYKFIQANYLHNRGDSSTVTLVTAMANFCQHNLL